MLPKDWQNWEIHACSRFSRNCMYIHIKPKVEKKIVKEKDIKKRRK